MEEGRRKTYTADQDDFEFKEDYCKPRDSLLSISAEFCTKCHGRLKELRKILADPAFRPPELLDHKAHNVGTCVMRTFIEGFCIMKFFFQNPLTQCVH